MKGIYLIVVAVLIVCINGCSRNKVNKFIVPMGFRGAIRIETGNHDGFERENSEGVTTYRIPKSGILRLRDAGPFTSWERMRASYEDGSNLLTEHDVFKGPDQSTSVPDQGTVALWILFTDSDDNIWFYVGTYEEYLEASSQGSGKLIAGERIVSK